MVGFEFADSAIPHLILCEEWSPVSNPRSNSSHHRLETVSRACQILRLFEDDRKALSLAEVCERTGLERTITFRLLHTLEQENILRRVDRRRYCSNVRLQNQKRFRIGYTSSCGDSFSRAVTQGLQWEARCNLIDLVEMESRYSTAAALRNAHLMVRERVDLVIEFQVHERIATEIAAIYQQAYIPVIAVEVPHPSAIFFGVDNHRVGQLAGKALARAATKNWGGEFDELLILDLAIAGSLPNLRLSSAESMIRKSLPGHYQVLHLELGGGIEQAFELTRRRLRLSPVRRTLITGINDLAVLGALRAFEEVGRSGFCFAAGVGALPEARREMRSPRTRLVGSVAPFPERYGEGLVKLAFDILRNKPVPSAIYAPIQLITPENIDEFYPRELFNDEGAERPRFTPQNLI
jgi:ribose transport system substrate-binding protein